MPRITRIGQKAPTRQADPCHKARRRASAPTCLRRLPKAKSRPAARCRPKEAQLWADRVPISSPGGAAASIGRMNWIRSKFLKFALNIVSTGEAPCRLVGDCTNDERNTLYSRNSGTRRGVADRLFSGHMDRCAMKDEKNRDEEQTGTPEKDPRRERLKQALRENLKRRKSQARGRDDFTMTSSNPDDVPPHDRGGKAPGK